MRKATLTTAAFCLGLAGLFCSPVQAHYPWLNTDGYCRHLGELPKITVGFGHRYPLGRFLQQEDLAGMTLLDPAGRVMSLISENAIEFEPEEGLKEPGVYTVAAQRKAGFYTKTTEGGKRQSKEGLSNVLKCSRSHMGMKALLTAGDKAGESALSKNPVGHPLEIIPQANPAALKAGEYFPVQVLLRGQPYQGKVFATYMGFSTDKDVFAYAAKTDRDGMGRIRILQPGIWLIKAEYEEPYADQTVCDVESFSATLTLEVK